MPEVVIDEGVRPHASAGVLLMVRAHVDARNEALDAAMREAEARIRADQRITGTADLQVRGSAAGRIPESPDLRTPDLVRAMYRRFGVDPTKTRPSSEALLRRVRKGAPLPRINTAVDVCNWSSSEFGLPYGLYDADRIAGRAVTLRAGREGEEYGGIRKDVVHVAGRLVVADEDGPFGNPTSDSARTMVMPGERTLLVVVYTPRTLVGPLLERVLAVTSERLARFTGAVEESRSIV